MQIDRSKVQLEKLRKSNAYDDVFKILPGPTFYTISGLRLGRLNSHLVEWTEVNAAWGQAVLLLDTLAKVGSHLQSTRDKEFDHCTEETGGGKQQKKEKSPKTRPSSVTFDSGVHCDTN